MSFNRSYSNNNGQGGQPRTQPSLAPAPRGVQNGSRVHIQPQFHGVSDAPVPASRGSRDVSKAPPFQNAHMSSAPYTSPTFTLAKKPGDSSKPLLQFGSISPGVFNGMQIPARTNSVPPNLDEQKRSQARQESFRAAPAPAFPTPIPKAQMPWKDQGLIDHPHFSDAHPIPKVKKDVQVSPAPPIGQSQKPSALPIGGMPMPIHNQPMQSQGVPASSLQQQGGKFGPPPPRKNPVKITNPKTHEELRFEKRTDGYADGGSSGLRSHSNVPPQSQTSPTYSPSHPMSFYQAPYANSMYYPNPSPLPLTGAAAAQYNYPGNHGAQNVKVVNPSAIKRKVSDEESSKQRQLKAILNKLTPQNFDKLFEQVKVVNIDNSQTLRGVIAQIFDKALMEPTFCEMYANFCLSLSGVLPDFIEDEVKITFKRLLLNKCQEEFERGKREQEEANKADEEGEVKQSEEEREEKRIKARRRMLGNIRLIGELFKKRMLTERIMHECIKKLLGQHQTPDEEDIEALCILMSTIGEGIDHSKAKEHMEAYFDGMRKLSINMKLSSRVRVMLKDLIDLRKNNWQQRRKVEGQKMINKQVHRSSPQEGHPSRGTIFNQQRRSNSPMMYQSLPLGDINRDVTKVLSVQELEAESSAGEIIGGTKNSPPSRGQVQSSSQSIPTEKVLSEEELHEKSMAAIKEFYSARDIKEVSLCIKELNTPSFHPTMISTWVTDSFEAKDTQRDLLAKLLVDLTASDNATLSPTQLIKGFEAVLEIFEDLVIDIPKATNYLSRMFAKVITERVVLLKDIARIIHGGGEEPGSLLLSGLAGEILGSTLNIIKCEKGDDVSNELVKGARLRLRNFRPPHPQESEALEKFIYHFAFTFY